MRKIARRNRAECDGRRKCAAIESIRARRVRAAAITCTTRILLNPFLADDGSEKLAGFPGGAWRDSRNRLEDLGGGGGADWIA
jgi:hypothetical protein